MSPTEILSLVALLSAAIQKAPAIINNVREFTSALFGKGLIDKATQDKLRAWVDARCEAALKGEVGPEWAVEADPV